MSKVQRWKRKPLEVVFTGYQQTVQLKHMWPSGAESNTRESRLGAKYKVS